MKATEFEYRHQALVHRLIVGAAFLTYLVDREDVVWRFVKDSATPHELERRAFILASLFIAAGAILCTWARACCRASSGVVRESYRCPYRRTYLGDLCYAIGLGSLAPLAGFVILVTGEALRVFRLMRRIGGPTRQDRLLLGRPLVLPVAEEIHPRWGSAFRQEAIKWGLLVTMIVFVITLKDRHAEVLAAASFLVGLLLKAPIFGHSSDGR
jgi:hypothetical protein